MNEAETRAEHIDPALKAAGWGVVEGSRIRREYPITPGRIEGHGRCGKSGRRSCCCWPAATSVRRTPTSNARCGTGRTGNGGQRMKDLAHDESMAELFREDAAFATQYLNDVLEEGDQADLLIALRQMAQAFGGVPAIAEKADLNATQLYRTLSAEGNPELRSLTAVLKAMGMRLAVQPIRHV